MGEKFLCIMAEFDKETNEKLDNIKETLKQQGFKGRQTPNIPNHITLGTYKVEDEELVISKLNTLNENFTKIPVSFTNIGLFSLDVLFISPSISKELIDLQKEFNNSEEHSYDWVAHVTMLIDDKDEIQRCIPVLAKEFKPFKGTIEKVSAYEFFPSKFIYEKYLK